MSEHRKQHGKKKHDDSEEEGSTPGSATKKHHHHHHKTHHHSRPRQEENDESSPLVLRGLDHHLQALHPSTEEREHHHHHKKKKKHHHKHHHHHHDSESVASKSPPPHHQHQEEDELGRLLSRDNKHIDALNTSIHSGITAASGIRDDDDDDHHKKKKKKKKHHNDDDNSVASRPRQEEEEDDAPNRPPSRTVRDDTSIHSAGCDDEQHKKKHHHDNDNDDDESVVSRKPHHEEEDVPSRPPSRHHAIEQQQQHDDARRARALDASRRDDDIPKRRPHQEEEEDDGPSIPLSRALDHHLDALAIAMDDKKKKKTPKHHVGSRQQQEEEDDDPGRLLLRGLDHHTDVLHASTVSTMMAKDKTTQQGATKPHQQEEEDDDPSRRLSRGLDHHTDVLHASTVSTMMAKDKTMQQSATKPHQQEEEDDDPSRRLSRGLDHHLDALHASTVSTMMAAAAARDNEEREKKQQQRQHDDGSVASRPHQEEEDEGDLGRMLSHGLDKHIDALHASVQSGITAASTDEGHNKKKKKKKQQQHEDDDSVASRPREQGEEPSARLARGLDHHMDVLHASSSQTVMAQAPSVSPIPASTPMNLHQIFLQDQENAIGDKSDGGEKKKKKKKKANDDDTGVGKKQKKKKTRRGYYNDDMSLFSSSSSSKKTKKTRSHSPPSHRQRHQDEAGEVPARQPSRQDSIRRMSPIHGFLPITKSPRVPKSRLGDEWDFGNTTPNTPVKKLNDVEHDAVHPSDHHGDTEIPSVAKKAVSQYPNESHPALEFPLLYHLLRPFPGLLRCIRSLYRVRWHIAYPLQRRLPVWRNVFFTWGEILLVVPFFAMLVVALVFSFLIPSVTITGHASSIPLVLAFVTAAHNSLCTLLLGIPFERALFYHKLSAAIASIDALLHAYVANGVNMAGTYMMACIMLVVFTSWMRRRLFLVFYCCHLLFAIAAAVAAFFHMGILVPALLGATLGFDFLVRRAIMTACLYPKRARLRIVSDTVVEVVLPKTQSFRYNPGQYVFLAVPRLTIFRWHALPLSSSPMQNTVTLHVRACGPWTTALYELAKKGEKEVTVLLEGPYGSLGVDLLENRYSMVLLFGGGIGVAPMQSIGNYLMHQHSVGKRELLRLQFCWIERDPIVPNNKKRGAAVARSNNAAFRAVSECLNDGRYPLNLASSILSSVPASYATDQDLERLYPSEQQDEDDHRGEENSALVGEAPRFESFHDEASTTEPYQTVEWAARKPPDEPFDLRVHLTANEWWLDDLAAFFFVRFGRPNVSKLLLEMRREALFYGESRIAVVVCAPKRLVRLLEAACAKHSFGRVRFDLHSEILFDQTN